jgi:hypothetical protein
LVKPDVDQTVFANGLVKKSSTLQKLPPVTTPHANHGPSFDQVLRSRRLGLLKHKPKEKQLDQPEKITVTLTLVDGQRRTFTFQPPPNQQLRIAARVKEFIKQELVAFQLPDRLLMIPMAQVKSIEFTPVTEKTIDGVFGNAEEITT